MSFTERLNTEAAFEMHAKYYFSVFCQTIIVTSLIWNKNM